MIELESTVVPVGDRALAPPPPNIVEHKTRLNSVKILKSIEIALYLSSIKRLRTDDNCDAAVVSC